MLNDIENNNFPVLEFKLGLDELLISPISTLIKGNFYLNFNSPVSHSWEPVLEPFWFVITKMKQQNEEIISFSLDFTRSKELKINLTEEFVRLYSTLPLLISLRLSL